jgi:hypothetical protein
MKVYYKHVLATQCGHPQGNALQRIDTLSF